MTRETKIGLLVGLAFIIVIGILLSDHLTSTMQPPQAPLGVAATVRESVNTPGAGQVTTANPVRLTEVPNPVILPRDEQRRDPRAEVIVIPPPAGRELATRRNHEPVVIPPPRFDERLPQDTHAEAAQSGSPSFRELLDVHAQDLVAETQPPVATREYKAEPKDTLSGLARKHLGADTKANRDAIVKLNPSLQRDPHMIRAGETYLVPAAARVAMPVATPAPAENGVVSVPTTRPGGAAETLYVVKPNDTLWGIARREVGSITAVQQIKDLNQDVLKGSDRLKLNMKLRLPPRRGASAQASSL